MNRLSLMVLALTMSSPTLLAGVVANYDFKEMNLKSLQLVNCVTRITTTKTKTSTFPICISVPAFLEMSAIVPTT